MEADHHATAAAPSAQPTHIATPRRHPAQACGHAGSTTGHPLHRHDQGRRPMPQATPGRVGPLLGAPPDASRTGGSMTAIADLISPLNHERILARRGSCPSWMPSSGSQGGSPRRLSRSATRARRVRRPRPPRRCRGLKLSEDPWLPVAPRIALLAISCRPLRRSRSQA